jgi:hypothetical protein
MTEQPPPRRIDAAQRYDQRQREIRSGTSANARPRPREFDANGFPLPQESTSFLDRVARLLNPF